MISAIATFGTAAVVSLLLTFPVVWLLTIIKAGQPVRVEAPSSHRAKAGTPTMGGVGFIVTILIMAVILINVEFRPAYLALIGLVFVFALIGLADDLLKIFRKQNLGLTFWQKIFLQILTAGAFAIIMTYLGTNLAAHNQLWRFGLYNPLLYPLFITFVVVGAANAANLTDGLNGLLAGTAGIACLAFAGLAGRLGAPEAVTFSLIAAGAVFAFLYFNFPKASVFMGDVGSLALGAGLGGLAVILNEELRLVLIGGVFVIEALSVIVQVTSYKLFKRRVFKMTPLHHTFELMGAKEWVVVVGFWSVALLLGAIGTWI